MNSVEIENNEEIQRFVDVNELKTVSDSLFVAAVELDKPKKVPWLQKYVVQETYAPKTELVTTGVLTNEFPVSAIEALSQGLLQGDIRPKLFDKLLQQWTLLDSGSVVSCIPRNANDVIDPSVRLRSVNGGSIATYGTEEISIQIGRKAYKMQVIKADIQQTILGWDFFKRYRLSLDWNDNDELIIVDRKAKIQSVLRCDQEEDKTRISSVDCYEEPVFQNQQSQD